MIVPPYASRLVVLVALIQLGCVPGRTTERMPRPAEVEEIRGQAPAPGLVWHKGHWHQKGSAQEWVPGRWEKPPALE